MSAEAPITKENLDTYLKEVAKQFRKLNGKGISAEITLVGARSFGMQGVYCGLTEISGCHRINC